MLWRIEGTTLTPWRDVPYEDNLTTWASLFNRSNERVLLHDEYRSRDFCVFLARLGNRP